MQALTRKMLTALVVFSLASAASAQGVRWHNELEPALRTAAQTNRLVLLHFWAPWCGPCLELDREVFNQETVAAALETNFVPVKLNADQHKSVAMKYGVKNLPADVILTSGGEMVSSISSPNSATAYITTMNRIAAGQKAISGQSKPAAAPSGNPYAAIAQNLAPPTAGAQREVQQPFYDAGQQAHFAGRPAPYDNGVPQHHPAGPGQDRYAMHPSAGHDPNPVQAYQPQDHFGPASGAPPAGAAPPGDRYAAAAPDNRGYDRYAPVEPPPAAQAPLGVAAPDERYAEGPPPQHDRYAAQPQDRYAMQPQGDRHAHVPQGRPGPDPGQPSQQNYQQQPSFGPQAGQSHSGPVGQEPRYGAQGGGPGHTVQPGPHAVQNPYLHNSYGGQESPPYVQHPAQSGGPIQPPHQGPAASQPQPGDSQAPKAEPQPAVNPRPIGIDGYCPVTLVEGHRWVKGDVQWGAIHRGRTYLFASEAEQKRFLADPDQFSPALAGNDPVLAIDNQQAVPGQRKHGVYYNQRVYLFSGEATLARFSQNPDRYVEGVRQAMQQSTRQVR